MLHGKLPFCASSRTLANQEMEAMYMAHGFSPGYFLFEKLQNVFNKELNECILISETVLCLFNIQHCIKFKIMHCRGNPVHKSLLKAHPDECSTI